MKSCKVSQMLFQPLKFSFSPFLLSFASRLSLKDKHYTEMSLEMTMHPNQGHVKHFLGRSILIPSFANLSDKILHNIKCLSKKSGFFSAFAHVSLGIETCYQLRICSPWGPVYIPFLQILFAIISYFLISLSITSFISDALRDLVPFVQF